VGPGGLGFCFFCCCSMGTAGVLRGDGGSRKLLFGRPLTTKRMIMKHGDKGDYKRLWEGQQGAPRGMEGPSD